MATITEIKVSNIGPIERLSIPLPEDGGVVVLSGAQGSGKSTALRAIAATAGGDKADLSLRDGATRGAVEFGGAKLSVTRSRSARAGELEVDTIEGRYDIGALVDPMIKDAERADAARIKQLIALTGAKADPSMYRELLGSDRYDNLDVDDSTDDPIELFNRVVRAIQSYSRRLEKQAEELRVAVPEPADDSNTMSVHEAQQELRESERDLLTLQSRAETHAAFRVKFEHAQEQLEVLKSSYQGPTVEEAQAKSDDAYALVSKLSEQLAEAKQALMLCDGDLAEAKRYADQVCSFAAILSQSMPASTSDAEIEAAESAVKSASSALKDCIAREGRESEIARANEQNSRAAQLAELAELYRTKAKSAEAVLANALPLGDIRVVEGRLVVATDRSSNELFCELSHGERAILAIRTAAKFIPRGGVATISQELWAGISDGNRQAISEEAKRLGVVIITAEVTDEPLKAEVV